MKQSRVIKIYRGKTDFENEIYLGTLFFVLHQIHFQWLSYIPKDIHVHFGNYSLYVDWGLGHKSINLLGETPNGY